MTGSATHECLTLSARAIIAMDMASSTAFGQAVREALVKSPSRELRVNARSMLASLSRIDDEIAVEVEAYGGGGHGGERGGFISQTTVMVRIGDSIGRGRTGFALDANGRVLSWTFCTHRYVCSFVRWLVGSFFVCSLVDQSAVSMLVHILYVVYETLCEVLVLAL